MRYVQSTPLSDDAPQTRAAGCGRHGGESGAAGRERRRFTPHDLSAQQPL